MLNAELLNFPHLINNLLMKTKKSLLSKKDFITWYSRNYNITSSDVGTKERVCIEY